MKTLLFILLLIPMLSYSQEGGIRAIKTTSENIVFRSLAGNGNVIVGTDNNGVSTKIEVDGTTTTLTNGILSSISTDISSTLSTGWVVKWDGTKWIDFYNPNKQPLSGTTPTFDANNGVNASLTITGNTTVSMQNLVAETAGVFNITNSATYYKINFVGYNLRIGSSITHDSNGISLPVSSTYPESSIGWYYDGITVKIHKADYTTP